MSMDLQSLVNAYQPSKSTIDLVESTPLLLIAGVVGGGKNTVINELIKNEQYHLIVSHTTRPPRNNHGIAEVNGVDYHFIDRDDAHNLVQNHEFVEIKEVHGNYYGTSVNEIRLSRDAGKTAVTDIDIKGVVEYLQLKPDTHAIFLLPPSVETWLSRLERRYGGNLDAHQTEISKRFKTAYEEITTVQNDPRFILVINDDLNSTVKRINEIVTLRGEDHTSDYALLVTQHLLDFLKKNYV